jgi:hypothetical protein
MILSLSILALATIVALALVFEFLPEHLSPFLELALPCRTTFAFVISPFTAGGFPALESLCHIVINAVSSSIILAFLVDRQLFVRSEKIQPIDDPDGLAILVPRGYANEIAVTLPNQYILDLPANLDVQSGERKIMFFKYT